MATTLLLIHSSASPQRLAAARGRAGTTRWMFLGQDFARLQQWERELGAGFFRTAIRDELVAATAALRQPFLEALTEFGRTHTSPAWWASRVSERNTMVSPLFLHCAYLKVGADWVARGEDAVTIVSESWAVLESLADIGRRQGAAVTWLSRPNELASWLQAVARTLVRVGRFAWRAASQAAAGPTPEPLPTGHPRVLLHPFLDEPSLGADGEFKDRYMPGLRKWLESQGIAVAHLPVLFNMSRGNSATWRWLAASRHRFLNSYRCYEFSDYLSAFREARASCGFDFASLSLLGLGVGRLFTESQAFHAYDTETIDALLSRHLPRRLRERGIEFDLVVAEYENMIPDKLLVLGFREHAPRTKLVGFQHGALFQLFLCNFMTRGETAFAPLPDRIVANGQFFRDVMIEEGLPPERVVAGPALRYTHLWNDADGTDGGERSGVFVPLPFSPGDARELLTKLADAFRGENIDVSLKPHPMLRRSVVDGSGVDALPPNFKVVGGEIGPWLATARVVVALSSSALFEALAAGVPVVPVGRETGLDLNPLAWHRGLSRLFTTPAEIRDEARRLLQLTPAELDAYRRQTRQVLLESFGRVEDGSLRSFIDGLLPSATPAQPPNTLRT